MKKILGLLVCLFLLQCGSNNNSNNGGGGGSSNDVTITIPASAAGLGNLAYGVNPLRISLGSKVIWKNSDGMTHTATSDTSIWDTGDIAGGASSSAVTFDKAGTFPYHCSIHGSVSMSGEIIVQ